MPFVGGTPDNNIDPVALIQWLTQRKMQQGKNILDTAEPGATVASTGMDPKTFAALYGKQAKYDPNKVLKAETSEHLLDRNIQGYIQSLTPVQAANLGATALNYRTGNPGQTTVQGTQDAQAAGAARAATDRQIAEGTGADQVATAKTKAKTQLTQASTADVTATDVAQRTMDGINAWKKAPADTQAGLNQKLVYGTTQDEMTQDQQKQRLATSAIKQAILAQTDPSHTIHKFLAANGLNLNTVLAGSAMGIDALFGDYARFQQQMTLSGKEASNIILKMYSDDARDMSEKVFAGKVTPGQVLTIIKSREDGTPLPKGLEGAATVYDRGVQANFDANLQTALEKGDPFLTSMHDQVKLLEKQTDPSSLSEVADLVRKAAGYAATKAQLGAPTTDAQWKVFNDVWKKNTARASGVKYDAPWFGSNSWKPVGDSSGAVPPPQMGNVPQTVQDAMRPRGAPVGMAPMPANLGVQPVAGAPSTGNPVAGAAAQLSPDDQAAIAGYLKTLGIGTPPAPGKPPA
jgi:hypothetical protein